MTDYQHYEDTNQITKIKKRLMYTKYLKHSKQYLKHS